MRLKLFAVFVISLMGFNLSVASEVKTDIRYRSIIYMYPDNKSIDEAKLTDVFSGFKVVDDLPDVTTIPTISFSVINGINDDYPIPDEEYLSYFGRGLGEAQITNIQASNLAVVIDVAYPRKASLRALYEHSLALLKFAESESGLIWDSETRELFTSEHWREKRVDSWQEGVPNVSNHTVIHAYKSDGGLRAITLGMVKFGLPDIVVNDFSWSRNSSIGNLINLVSQSMVEGSFLDSQDMLSLDINALRPSSYKQSLIESLFDNAAYKAHIKISEAEWEEGDPDNYLVELRFDHVIGKSLSEKQDTFVSDLFGWQDQISYVQHNAEIEAVSQKAKARLPALQQAFRKGLKPGEFIQVKAPFKTPDGGQEWMWVEVLVWEKGTIKGILLNEPYHIPDLKGGAEVVVRQSEVFDYLRNYPDGTSEGNETGKLLLKYQQ